MQGQPRDVDLLAAASEGDSEAFGQIFLRHSKVVYNYCLRRLGLWSEAEDATSLVFLETWRRRRDAVDLDGSLLPWLIGVANNVMRNMSRASRRYESALFKIPPHAGELDPADIVADRLDDERRAKEIIGVLATLSRADRDVVAAVLMAGLTYAEAAVALSVPIGTVRSRMSRARKKLTVALEGSPAAPSMPPTAVRGR